MGDIFYVCRDPQTEWPVDYCARCGGEIYAFEPVEWKEGPPVCPVCADREERERERERMDQQ